MWVSTKTTDGTLVLSGTNDYTGVTTVAAGTLEAAGAEALPGYGTAKSLSVAPEATAAVLLDGAGDWSDADIAAFLANPSLRPATWASTWPTATTSTIRPPSSAIATFVKLGEGQPDPLRDEYVHRRDDGRGRYAGRQRRQRLGHAGNAIIITGGTLDMSSQDVTAGSLALVDGSVVGAGQTLTTGSYYGPPARSPPTWPVRRLYETGPGAVVLAGAASYTGLTTVYDGTLELGVNANRPCSTASASTSKAARSSSTIPPRPGRRDFCRHGLPGVALVDHLDAHPWNLNPPVNCDWWPVASTTPFAQQVTAAHTPYCGVRQSGRIGELGRPEHPAGITIQTGMTWPPW